MYNGTEPCLGWVFNNPFISQSVCYYPWIVLFPSINQPILKSIAAWLLQGDSDIKLDRREAWIHRVEKRREARGGNISTPQPPGVSGTLRGRGRMEVRMGKPSQPFVPRFADCLQLLPRPLYLWWQSSAPGPSCVGGLPAARME